jgi:hypothetical protein
MLSQRARPEFREQLPFCNPENHTFLGIFGVLRQLLGDLLGHAASNQKTTHVNLPVVASASCWREAANAPYGIRDTLIQPAACYT